MAERYRTIYDMGSARYADGAPLLICGGALLQDKFSRSTLVQMKLKNIGEKEISHVKLQIEAYDASGRALEPVEYLYQNVKARRDGEFGAKTAIVIPDKTASGFEPKVMEIIFSDKSRWDGAESKWTEIKTPRTIEQVFDDKEMATQFAIRYGNDCLYYPEEDRGLWFCACGLVNYESDSKCHGCRRVYSALKAINFTSLRNESAQRQEIEKKIENEDRAEQDIKKKRLIKLSFVLVPVLICLALVLATVPKYMAQKNDYAEAAALLSAGEFERAQQAFAALGPYSDSAEQAQYNVPYQKAVYIMSCAAEENVDGLLLLGMKRSELEEDETVGVALYKAADSLFAQLGSYKDSAALREQAQNAVSAHYAALVEAEYDAAAALLEGRSYLKARDAFLALGDYGNSAEMAREALYRRATELYKLAEKYSMKGVFSCISNSADTESIIYITEEAFAELGSGVSGEMREICRGDGVAINIENPPEEGYLPICSDISRLFTELGDYKDSAVYAESVIALGDFTKPFYELCESGKLYEAYVWLSEYEEEFEARDQWMKVLEMYGPYCGSWELKGGDPTLIPMTVGIEAPCNFFSTIVTIKDYVISLRIHVNGDTAYPIELPLAAEGGRFSVNHDGVNTYIAALANNGNFNYSRYSSYAISAQTNSCEYVRIA